MAHVNVQVMEATMTRAPPHVLIVQQDKDTIQTHRLAKFVITHATLERGVVQHSA